MTKDKVIFLALRTLRLSLHVILEEENDPHYEVLHKIVSMMAPANEELALILYIQEQKLMEARVLLALTEAEISRRCVWRSGHGDGEGPVDVLFDEDQWDDGNCMYWADWVNSKTRC